MDGRIGRSGKRNPHHSTNPPKHTPTPTAAQPVKFDGGLAFMFETCFTLRLSPWALQAPHLEKDYVTDCWARLPKLFTGGKQAETGAGAEEGK
jgi:homogentisate 1,2-dioxygenase